MTADEKNAKRITIETPCPVSEVENRLNAVAAEGRWHEAVVKSEAGKITIEFETD